MRRHRRIDGSIAAQSKEKERKCPVIMEMMSKAMKRECMRARLIRGVISDFFDSRQYRSGVDVAIERKGGSKRW